MWRQWLQEDKEQVAPVASVLQEDTYVTYGINKKIVLHNMYYTNRIRRFNVWLVTYATYGINEKLHCTMYHTHTHMTCAWCLV